MVARISFTRLRKAVKTIQISLTGQFKNHMRHREVRILLLRLQRGFSFAELQHVAHVSHDTVAVATSRYVGTGTALRTQG